MAPGIQPIDKAVVHRICSGQVILDLATAVKELIENSLDAGATSIEVRLKEHGSELIEVADNGHGVKPADYQALMLKYHTSKLSSFEELAELSSFGFRGEALSSLCAVADVSVVTRCADEETGSKITYDHTGNLLARTLAPRAVGTTIAVQNLFRRLPVRHREFQRGLKREYARLVSVLQSYALISTGLRLICTNQTGSGSRTVIVTTQGAPTIRDNVIALFGGKTAEALEPVDIDGGDGLHIVGLVSKATSGTGRAAGDRQFFFINGRPVDMPKASKLLNECFRNLSSPAAAASRPMAILNFQLPRDAYDVNVTPDKRKVFLHAEHAAMTALQQGLTELWEPSRSRYAVNGAVGGTQQTQGPGGGAIKGGKKRAGAGDAVLAPFAAFAAVGIGGGGSGASSQRLGTKSSLVQVKKEELEKEEEEEEEASSTSEEEEENENDGEDSKAAEEIMQEESEDGGEQQEEMEEGSSPRAEANIDLTKLMEEKEVAGEVEKEELPPAKRRKALASRDLASFALGTQATATAPGTSSPSSAQKKELSPSGASAVTDSALPGSKELALPRSGIKNQSTLLALGFEKQTRAARLLEEDQADGGGQGGGSAASPAQHAQHETTSADSIEILEDTQPIEIHSSLPPTQQQQQLLEEDTQQVNIIPITQPQATLGGREEESLEERNLDKDGEMVEEEERATGELQEKQKQEGESEINEMEASVEEGDISIVEAEDYAATVANGVEMHIDLDQIRNLTLSSARQAAESVKSSSRQKRPKFVAASLASTAVDGLSNNTGNTSSGRNGSGPGSGQTTREQSEVVAETELERIFKKSDFRKMQVLGQFNLGFIVARLGKDLFIVDQHASGENDYMSLGFKITSNEMWGGGGRVYFSVLR